MVRGEQLLPLPSPISWHICHESVECHVGRLPAFQNGLRDIRGQKSHLHEAEAAAAAVRETRAQAVAEYQHTLSDDLAKSEQKANGLVQDLIKAEQRTRLQELTAPVDDQEHWAEQRFDPTRVTAGIELSDDPVLAFRSLAYAESYRRRSQNR